MASSRVDTSLRLCCCCHFFLMIVMVTFGGFLLNDVFNCEGCLWFAVGTDHETSASTSSSGWNSSSEEAIEGSVNVYTGTVRNALGLNSQQTPHSDFTEACGMWVFHPHKWDSQPGKQIEFDVGVGSTPMALEAGAAYTASGINMPVAPLSDASVESSCKVSLGGDGQLRNYKQDNEVIAVGNCNKVSYVSDTSSGTNALAYKGRNVFGIIGLLALLLIRGMQYFLLFGGLTNAQVEKDRKSQRNVAQMKTISTKEKIINWCLLVLDFVFFSEFPGLLLLPLNALEFHGDCDQILTFRFSATLWLLGAGFALFGAVFHLADALFAKLCQKAPKHGLETGEEPENTFTALIWPCMMIGVGAILTVFVAVVKVIYIMQLGFTFAFGMKLEWAFRFQYWPIRQAVCLDMFQLSSFFFLIVDKIFNAYSGYLKYGKKLYAMKEAATARQEEKEERKTPQV